MNMKWFDNIRIRNKLFLVFGMLLFAAVFFAAFAIIEIAGVGDNLTEVIDSTQVRQIHLAEASADIYRIRLTDISRGYLVEEELNEIIATLETNHDENIKLFRENLLAYREIVLSDPRLAESDKQWRISLVNEIKDIFEEYVSATGKIYDAAEKKDRPEIIRVIERSIPLGNVLSDKVQTLRDLTFSTISQKTSSILDSTLSTIHITSYITAAFILLSIFILLFTVRHIDQPISNLEKAAAEIAKGNLSYPIRSGRRDEFGTLSNCIGDMIDELKNYNEMHETLKAAEMASAAKSSFLANMSHEIRTPMNVILGITEIQLKDETLEPGIKEALTKIYSSGDLLLSIINDILDLSKIEAGKLELLPREYEVASLINDTVALNMMHVGDKPIRFKLSVDENTPSALIGDELRIKQILNNLLSNAFKYTAEGTVRLSVSAGSESDNAEEATLVFRVSDTGQGMTKEQIAKLFDEYTRFNAQANRTTEGTGLGMSIARNLVGMMCGTITVESEPARGTVFTVRLPQERASNNVLGPELAKSLQNFQLDSAKQIRKAQFIYEPMPYGSVLIVDDVESNLYVAKGLLNPYGLSIDTVKSGIDAIGKIKSGKTYDIVFMDHMMPKMDGIEATKILRELGYGAPIVALTANAVAGQADIFLKSGFDWFISKPIDTRQLHIALKKFIRDKQPPVDPQLAEFFIQDALRAIDALENIYDMKTYITQVHAMKSALYNVGETELSAEALKLEQAGRDNDAALISRDTPAFIEKLKATVEKLAPPEKTYEGGAPPDEDQTYLREKLLDVEEACETYDKKTAKAIINELRQKTWPQKTESLLAKIAGYLLSGDFEEAASAVHQAVDIF